MKAKKIITTITITTITVTGLFSGAYAMHGNKGFHRSYHERFRNNEFHDRMPCDENLTDEERTQIINERKNFKNETRELRKELFDKRMAMEEQVCGTSPDVKKIKALRADIAVLRDALHMKRKAFMDKIHESHPEMHNIRKYHEDHHE